MFKSSKSDPVRDKDALFHELIAECKHAYPCSRLSYPLRIRLEKCSLATRREIVNRIKVGCAPLFIACQRGQIEIAEYLITVCHADIEQRGIYEVFDDRSVHVVTPLWCAAVSGKLSVLQLLVRHGADVNAVSDTGSTPVRSACFMTHYDVVEYLVKHGADINKPNHNGGTCLINSVQSFRLCAFLIDHGADVNARDIQNKTALHYAIQEHRMETTKLLLRYGADYTIKSRYGDDALQMACVRGAKDIYAYLVDTISYSPGELANADELMGATYLDEQNDITCALQHWRRAIRLREKYGLVPKTPIIHRRGGFRFQTEFQSLEELDALSTDLDSIRIQSLLIVERILGPNHKDTIFRIMYRGAFYSDMLRYQNCIDLWRIALKIRVEKDTMLYPDTCSTALALVILMIKHYENRRSVPEVDNHQRFKDSVAIFKLLTNNIGEMRNLLLVKPVFKKQMESFDRIIKCLTYLIYLMLKTAKTKENREIVTELVVKLLKLNPRTSVTEDTLLHLCSSNLNTLKSSYFDGESVVIFPNYTVVKFLLNCGASVHSKNESGTTPLHVAAMAGDLNLWLVKLLLDHGAHFDQPNIVGVRPYTIVMNRSDIPILDYISLKCLCARKIVAHKLVYENQIPKNLEAFIKLHVP